MRFNWMAWECSWTAGTREVSANALLASQTRSDMPDAMLAMTQKRFVTPVFKTLLALVLGPLLVFVFEHPVVLRPQQ